MYNSIKVKLSHGTTLIAVYDSNIIRVTHIPHDSHLEESFIVIKKPLDCCYTVEENDQVVKVNTDEVSVTIDKDEEVIIFDAGRINIAEVSRKFTKIIGNEDLYSIEHTFVVSNNEAFYGLGQHAGYSATNGFNYRNRTIYIAQRNTDIAVPFMVSSAGYGILWDTYSMGIFSSRGNILKMWFEQSKAIDFYLIYGPEIDRIIRGYRYLTGKAPMLPRYALGYWQSKERYATQDELITVVKRFRDKRIPIDVIVQDWRYWGKYGWNAFKFDEEFYPDPLKMVKDLHDMGVRIMISIWPMFEKTTAIYVEAQNMGCLMGNGDKDFGLLNVFDEKCREWFWSKIEETFFSIGIDGWWLDASEPEVKPLLIYSTWQKELDTGRGRMGRYLNLYPLLEAKAVYEGQRKTSNKRVLILTRSGFAGIQRYGVINWSGDVTGDWTTFRTQIQAGLNYALSGLPYWTTDIGGFFSGNPDTDSYRELFVRWFQFAVFNPVMRVHGTYYPKEPWRFGDRIEKVLIDYIKLRYRLLPYIYTLVWKTYSEDYTIMRPLVMDFREDPEVYNIDDQFMFGPYILVSPITRPTSYERELYLPKGIWYDFWTGETVTGGRYIICSSPLERIPLHIRSGSLIPLAPASIMSTMDDLEWIELRIYRGRDADFGIYIDDGETYGYENGDYALIPIKWINSENKLIIGNKIGKYRIRNITIRAVLVDKGKGVGIEESKPDKEFIYRGESIEIKF